MSTVFDVLNRFPCAPVVAKRTAKDTRGNTVARGGTWVFFGWVRAARDLKLAPRSKKKFP